MRNPQVFYLDVQSGGAVGDDGQSVCELQAVRSVLSQLLRFVVHLFCASGICKTEATLLFIVHLTRCSWMQLGMCNAFEVVFCVLCSQAPTNSAFFGKDVMHFVFCRVLSSFAK